MTTDDERAPRILAGPDGQAIAYRGLDGAAPGVVFLCGYMSDMRGTKATSLERHCRETGRAFLRFDYRGTGESPGEFSEGTIGLWTDDALAALDSCTEGPQILVGSSMGGWIMLLAALARPSRVAGLVGIAAAPDFTEDLIRGRLGELARRDLAERGVCAVPGGPDPQPVTRALIEDGSGRLLLRRRIPLRCPVRLLHGMRDAEVPWTTSARLAERLLSDDVRTILIKDGDHRLSRERDIDRLLRVVDRLAAETGDAGAASGGGQRPATARNPLR